MFSGLVLAAFLASLAHCVSAGRLRVVERDVELAASHDFIVIGGGTSGLTVADRLTETQTVSRKLPQSNGHPITNNNISQ